MELFKKRGFKICLKVIVDEILSEIRNDLILMTCSKIGILKISLVVVALI